MSLRFSTDEGLIRREPNLEKWYPRTVAKTGELIRNWDVQHDLAMEDISRLLRGMKSTAEPFELGLLDPRSQSHLRPAAECFALHHIFMACDAMHDETGFFFNRARYYKTEAENMLRIEAQQLDYDTDRSGSVTEDEKQQPIIMRVTRG